MLLINFKAAKNELLGVFVMVIADIKTKAENKSSSDWGYITKRRWKNAEGLGNRLPITLNTCFQFKTRKKDIFYLSPL